MLRGRPGDREDPSAIYVKFRAHTSVPGDQGSTSRKSLWGGKLRKVLQESTFRQERAPGGCSGDGI